MPDRRIKGRPLTEMLEAAATLEELEQQKRELDAQMQSLHRSQGQNLRAVRQSAGISMGDLASSLGTSKSYISQVENGVRGASSTTLYRFYNHITSVTSETSSDGSFSYTFSGAVAPSEENHDGEDEGEGEDILAPQAIGEAAD